MLSADRRLQEGSRALGIAFNIGRAEEALFRVAPGQMLTSSERSYFKQIADLFADARAGAIWIQAMLEGTGHAYEADTLQQLRAFALVAPSLDAETDPATKAEAISRIALAVSTGETPSADETATLLAILDRLASHASAEGMEALETSLVFPPLAPLERGRHLVAVSTTCISQDR